MILEPVIFDNPQEFERAVDAAVAALRRADAEKLRLLADEYELRALREPQFSYDAGQLEGQAVGLRAAAAAISVQAALLT